MKKIYILALVAFAFTFTANAQFFDDDIESYPVGAIHTGPWLSWDGTAGTADDIEVSEDEAASGTKSILVAEGGVIDGIMDLGNVDSGIWYLDFKMYIPAGKGGYFNLQDELPAGTKWNWHCTFNEGGTDAGNFSLASADGANQGPGTVLGTGVYPEDAWFDVSIKFDIDAQTMDFSIDGTSVGTDLDLFGDSLGGLNLFSNEGSGASNRYYIDDARFDNTPILAIDDFNAASFSVYPNPVQNRLNIQTTNVVEAITVYDVLGKALIVETPGVISPSIDMSTLSSGAYLVNVRINGASKTVKVVK